MCSLACLQVFGTLACASLILVLPLPVGSAQSGEGALNPTAVAIYRAGPKSGARACFVKALPLALADVILREVHRLIRLSSRLPGGRYSLCTAGRQQLRHRRRAWSSSLASHSAGEKREADAVRCSCASPESFIIDLIEWRTTFDIAYREVRVRASALRVTRLEAFWFNTLHKTYTPVLKRRRRPGRPCCWDGGPSPVIYWSALP